MRLALLSLAFLFACALGFGCSEEAPPAPVVADAAPASEPPLELPPPITRPRPYSEKREPCADRDPQRRAYFGDFHVHTNVSMDAYIFDVRSDARAAYRFARGEAIPVPRSSASDTYEIRLERPLDFAAVTDHAEYLGEVKLCSTEGSPVYDLPQCRMYRGEIEVEIPEGFDLGGSAVTMRIGARMAALSGRDADITSAGGIARLPELCGADGAQCRDWNRRVWQDARAAAEEAYDRTSACTFTSFEAYEYTATPALAKVHHNIIFRNDRTLDIPVSYGDVPDAYDMWAELEARCLAAGTGCDVVSIPHNSNLSNGRMFQVDHRDLPEAQQRARAELRARLEPLVEIMQIKGDSECRNGLAGVVGDADELCDFERFRATDVAWDDCGDGGGAGALGGKGCISKRDYVRYALAEGLREEARIGVNPFKMGFIASTDTHDANPGDVEERSYDGWSGTQDSTPQKRLQGKIATLAPIASNPGGLVGIWSEENSRDALFDAMKRRETFGTSGPRIQPRFFGGWSYAADACERQDELVARGYLDGVAMGGDLREKPADADAPVFMVSALRDAGTAAFPGNGLERIQIIKAWAGADGTAHQRVFDVAGAKSEGAGVDPATCAPTRAGNDALCSVWRDPEFDASQPAVYYARVVEVPSCRWSTWQCLALPESERPAACSDPSIPKTIQERAWTSPIWYAPAKS